MGFYSSNSSKKSNASSVEKVNGLPIQAKLRYGAPGDKYEQEADRVADQVVNDSKSQKGSGALGGGISPYVAKAEDEKEDAAGKENQEAGEEKEGAGAEDKKEKEEDKSVQKSATDKKEEEKHVQKESSDKKEEEKPVQKEAKDKKEEEKPVQKKSDKKEEEKPVQKEAKDKKEEEKPVQKKSDKKEEEKPVQKEAKDKKEEEKPVQKKSDKKEEEKPVQKEAKDKKEEEAAVQKKEAKKEEEKPVQKKEKGGSKNNAEVEQMLKGTLSGGKPMEESVMADMQKSFGRDFKDVRIHTDGVAQEMCKKINATAFTYGNHIYFSEGAYNPKTQEGKRLLAHELTHVVQQSWTIRTKVVQKSQTPVSTGGGGTYKLDSGKYKGAELTTDATNTSGTLKMDKLRIPRFKSRNKGLYNGPLKVRKGKRPKTEQTKNWKNEMEPYMGILVDQLLPKARKSGAVNAKDQHFFQAKNNSKLYVIGSRQELIEGTMIPFWDDKGKATSFQVDHILEMQLMGEDITSNYELLEASANMAAGGVLRKEISDTLEGVLEAFQKKNSGVSFPLAGTVKSKYDVEFARAVFNLDFNTGSPDSNWAREEIRSGNHLDKLVPLTAKEMKELGSPGEVKIFTGPIGGTRMEVPKDENQGKTNWLPRVNLKSYTINPGGLGGQLVVEAFKAGGDKLREYKNKAFAVNPVMTWPLVGIPGVYGGGIDKNAIAQNVKNSLQIPGLSPIQMNDLDVVAKKGLMGRGKLTSDLSVIKGAELDVTLEGSDVHFSKSFDLAEIKLPSPFKPTGGAVTVFTGTKGIGASGTLEFGIKNVGTGLIEAEASSGRGFNFKGKFRFDSKLFDENEIRVAYKDGNWEIGGTLAIKKGKIRGIKAAKIDVNYAKDIISAAGEVEPDIPAVQSGKLAATLGEDFFKISGEVTLGAVTGIKGGTITATVEKKGEEYKVSAAGKVIPNIPGITAELSAEYDNGAMTFTASADFERGKIKGKLNVGVTNRLIGEDGQPAGEPADTFKVYGGGTVTMKVTEWLEGTIGVQLQPDGQVLVKGRLAIPKPLKIFEKKSLEKNIIPPLGFDIPIFAIPVGPKSIGLKASIKGSLIGYASLGPGMMDNLAVDVEYNPEKPQETKVHGEGRFWLPAEAGISLQIDASIGLNAVIGGVDGGGYIKGSLGIGGYAQASCAFDWSPDKGFDLAAKLEIGASPKFKLEVGLFISAWVAWWDKTWRWNLGEWEWGSDYAMKATMPIKYTEGQPFNFNYEDMTFEKPDIDPVSTLKSVFKDLRKQK